MKMGNNWIPFAKVFEVISFASSGKWDWVWNPRCKYINIRIDMRDGHCVIFDRDGKQITLEELQYQNMPERMKEV